MEEIQDVQYPEILGMDQDFYILHDSLYMYKELSYYYDVQLMLEISEKGL